MWNPRLSRGNCSPSRQRPRLRLVAPQRILHRAHPHAHPVHAPQPLGNRMVGLGRHRIQPGRHRLGRTLQLGKVVAPLMEDVARLLVGQQDPPPARQRQPARILARHPPRPVERQHAPRRIRVRRHALQLGIRHRLGAQQRIGEHLAQPELQLALLRTGQGGQIHPQHFGQLHHQARRHIALVMLDQVQIARRNPQPCGQRLLAQPLLGPQPPHRPPDQRPRHRSTPSVFTNFTTLQPSCHTRDRKIADAAPAN